MSPKRRKRAGTKSGKPVAQEHKTPPSALTSWPISEEGQGFPVATNISFGFRDPW